MEPTILVMICFVLGVLVLVAEIFLPSHGVLTVVGLGFMAYAIYVAYRDISNTAGHSAILAMLIVVPTVAIIAVKTFHRTPWGRKISPDNPVVNTADFAPQYESLRQYIGQTGRSVTPLRPVGICIFNGRRVNCVAESGMVDKDMPIRGVGIRGHELEVSPVEPA